jgi:hypothetical protein
MNWRIIGIAFVIGVFLFLAAALIYNIEPSPMAHEAKGIELYPDGTLIEIH